MRNYIKRGTGKLILVCMNPKCKKEFKRYASQLNGKLIFCSRSCSSAYYAPAERNGNYKGGLAERICPCGKVFHVKKKTVRNGGGKYCSNPCRFKYSSIQTAATWSKRRIIKFCKVCGKKIMVKPSHVDIEGSYCSKECLAKGYAERFEGEGNPNYRHGESHAAYHRRKSVTKGSYSRRDVLSLLRRQMYTCVYCPNSLKVKFHEDHIIPLSRGGSNSIGNIQLLCPSCNAKKYNFLPVEYRKRVGFSATRRC